MTKIVRRKDVRQPLTLPERRVRHRMISRQAVECMHPGYSWRRMSEKCLHDPLGFAHEVFYEVCLIITQILNDRLSIVVVSNKITSQNAEKHSVTSYNGYIALLLTDRNELGVWVTLIQCTDPGVVGRHVWLQSTRPKVRESEGSLVRRFFSPKVRKLEKKVLESERKGSVVRRSRIPKS